MILQASIFYVVKYEQSEEMSKKESQNCYTIPHQYREH